MAPKLAAGVVLAIAVVWIGRPTAPDAVDSPPTGAAPLLDYLEHRGAMYAIEDLMDPQYRAASDDPFVREFDPDAVIAESWAGLTEDTGGF